MPFSYEIMLQDIHFYFILLQEYKMLSFNDNSDSSPWKKIWVNNALLKLYCCSWLVARKACLTQSNLQRRGCQLCCRCPLCEDHPEMSITSFPTVKTHISSGVQIFPILGMTKTMPLSTPKFFQYWNISELMCPSKFGIIPQAIWWIVQTKINNKKILKGKKQNILSLNASTSELLRCQLFSANQLLYSGRIMSISQNIVVIGMA